MRVMRVVSVEGPRWSTLAGRMSAETRRAALREVLEAMTSREPVPPTEGDAA